jgi:hypothetical protein
MAHAFTTRLLARSDFVLLFLIEKRHFCNKKQRKMILKKTLPTYLAAPEFTNTDATLSKFQIWSGNATASLDDFYAFVTTPSVDRIHFLTVCSEAIIPVTNVLIRQKYV